MDTDALQSNIQHLFVQLCAIGHLRQFLDLHTQLERLGAQLERRGCPPLEAGNQPLLAQNLTTAKALNGVRDVVLEAADQHHEGACWRQGPGHPESVNVFPEFTNR